ncbi:chitinase domain-containing protein 1 [Impatiens glandulifera]|uniref:chitinase domain-containing protein 1 n=1 Tax=Impatiens glandulifera TaxID=253017 RepID=UPI001FB17A7A|nr:chitinase domain-containing protein 1 [Impatiens glandulifera]
MAKKRERRISTDSDRRRIRNGSDPPTGTDRIDNSAESNATHERKLIFIFVLFFIVIPAISVIVYSIWFDQRSGKAESPLPFLYQGGLVKTDISYEEVLNGNSKVLEDVTRRGFNYPVLAYVTPWNAEGYEVAKRFNSKFTHLSPVWYDLKRDTKLVLEGRHNVDKDWISQVRERGNVKVLPRVVLEAPPGQVLKKKKQRNNVIDLIVTECKEMDYDGIVLESWSIWAAYGVLHDPELRNLAIQFVEQLGQALHSVERGDNKQHMELIYVIRPPYSEKLEKHDFGPEDIKRLSNAVDGFSLMTYDFSSPQNPGPNAPLNWIHSTMQLLLEGTKGGSQSVAHKIFVGINFYGNDFELPEGVGGTGGGGPIIGSSYLSVLEKHKPPFRWEENSKEHYFMYLDNSKKTHAVFYPSPMSIALRVEEARSWGAGISIWEIGQGLDYFMDLF